MANTLEDTRARLEGRIGQLRDELAKVEEALGQLQVLEQKLSQFGELAEAGDWAQLGITEAVRRVFQADGKARTTRELAEELLLRGVRTKAKNFQQTVYMVLRENAASTKPVFKQVGEGKQAKWVMVGVGR